MESEAIPYELFIITGVIDVGIEGRSRSFEFIFNGYYRADIACQKH